jgi:hypothetical protein
MPRLHHRKGSWWATIAFRSFALVMAVFALGCGRFFLSDEISRIPAVAAADGFGPAPATATVWVEVVAPGFLGVVGKAFDEPDSITADAAPLKSLSPPIAIVHIPGVPDSTDAVAGLDVVRIDGGFFVVWQLKGSSIFTGGSTWGLFTDLALNPSGSPILLFASSPLPTPAQARNELWAYYAGYRDRLVVLTTADGAQLTYAVIDSQTRQVLNVSELPDQMPFADVSYDPGPNRPPFMVSYLSPEGDLTDPFRVRAAFLDFDAPAESLLVRCRADVSEKSSNDFNNTAGATHPFDLRYVVWDERDGDIFGAFVRDDCATSPEFFLGTRSIVSALGGQPARSFFPMDVRFDSTGNGLVAMKQAIPSNLVLSGITFVVSVLPLEFDGLVISGGAVRPVGLPRRRGVPYSNRTFQLRSDFEAFKLVFDEVEIDEDRAPMPSTWRVLFNALDATGDTI